MHGKPSIPIARYEFGPYVVDVACRTLQRNGETISLAPKALDLLIALLERPRRVVSKREILQRVWPDTFVEEANVTQNISLLRKALQDGAEDASLVVTIPRVGYQFTAAVRAIPLVRDTSALSIYSSATQSVAVIPFELISLEEAASVGASFADAVADILRRLPVFVQTVPVSGGDVGESAASVGADAFLCGYCQRNGTFWNVTIQLFRTADRALVWASSVRGEFTTVNDVREAVASEVFTSLQTVLSRPHLSTQPAAREVFRLYVTGRHGWNKRTPEGLRAALDCAVEAVEVDPASARGYVGIADTYNLMGGQHGMLSARQAFPRARSAARRALEVDEACGEAYASLAFVSYWFDWDMDEAERNFRRAAELKPTYATTYHWWAEVLACAGRFRESISLYETALDLDPLSSAIRTDFAAALSLAGEYQRSEAMISEVLQFNKEFVRAVVVLALNAERKGDPALSFEQAVRALERDRSPSVMALAARSAAAADKLPEARWYLEQIEQRSANENVVDTDIATVYAALGRHSDAESCLERAFEKHEPHVAWLMLDPAFDVLRARTSLLQMWNSATVSPR